MINININAQWDGYDHSGSLDENLNFLGEVNVLQDANHLPLPEVLEEEEGSALSGSGAHYLWKPTDKIVQIDEKISNINKIQIPDQKYSDYFYCVNNESLSTSSYDSSKTPIITTNLRRDFKKPEEGHLQGGLNFYVINNKAKISQEEIFYIDVLGDKKSSSSAEKNDIMNPEEIIENGSVGAGAAHSESFEKISRLPKLELETEKKDLESKVFSEKK
jgi:hypothetical protein